jgi:hypothetical protein
VELFDLQKDPAEKNSIAESKPTIAKRLASELREWQQSVLNSLIGQDY